MRLWFGFRFYPDGSGGSPPELAAEAHIPTERYKMGRPTPLTSDTSPWHVIHDDDAAGVMLVVAGASKHGAEFLLWIREPSK